MKHTEIIAKSKYDLGSTGIVKHETDTGNSKKIKQQMCRLPLNKHKDAKQEFEAMLANEIIEPSTSAWASPTVLVSKKDSSTRFCVDYSKLNEVTCKDSYRLQIISDCFDALGDTKWFSTIDLQSVYW